MARLNPYERRMLEMAKLMEAGPKSSVPLPTGDPVTYARTNPQDANRVARIRFGPQALRDFPRLASIWAEETIGQSNNRLRNTEHL